MLKLIAGVLESQDTPCKRESWSLLATVASLHPLFGQDDFLGFQVLIPLTVLIVIAVITEAACILSRPRNLGDG